MAAEIWQSPTRRQKPIPNIRSEQLLAFCKAEGVKLAHVKPHGAFYNMAAKDYDLAKAICEGIYEVDPSIKLLGLSNSKMIEAAKIRSCLAQEYLQTVPMKKTELL